MISSANDQKNIIQWTITPNGQLNVVYMPLPKFQENIPTPKKIRKYKKKPLVFSKRTLMHPARNKIPVKVGCKKVVNSNYQTASSIAYLQKVLTFWSQTHGRHRP